MAHPTQFRLRVNDVIKSVDRLSKLVALLAEILIESLPESRDAGSLPVEDWRERLDKLKKELK